MSAVDTAGDKPESCLHHPQPVSSLATLNNEFNQNIQLRAHLPARASLRNNSIILLGSGLVKPARSYSQLFWIILNSVLGQWMSRTDKNVNQNLELVKCWLSFQFTLASSTSLVEPIVVTPQLRLIHTKLEKLSAGYVKLVLGRQRLSEAWK